MVPDGGGLSGYPQLTRYLGRTHGLDEQPGGSQPPQLQGAAISASRHARTAAGTFG